MMIPERIEETLIQYLLSHEEDIASCVNDFGDLLSVFIALIGREPEEDITIMLDDDVFSDLRKDLGDCCE